MEPPGIPFSLFMVYTKTKKPILKHDYTHDYTQRFVKTKLIQENGYEAKQVSLLYNFANIFGLNCAQTTIDQFEMCWSNWPIETFLLKYSAVVRRLKQRIVHCRGPLTEHYQL